MSRFDCFICGILLGVLGSCAAHRVGSRAASPMGTLTLEQLCNRPKYPSQRAFHESTAAETVLYGGLGSGKTDPLCEKAIHLSWSIPDNEGFIGRAHETELEDHTIPQFLGLVPDELVLDWEKGAKRLTLRSYMADHPSVIWFGHVQEAQPGKDHLKGGNWGWFGIDQVESITESRWNDLKGRLRRKGTKVHPAFGNANPNGHDWGWRRWIYPAEQGGHVETVMVPGKIGGQMVQVESKRYRAGRTKFAIAAQTAENLSLPDDYISDKIENNPPEWVDRYMYCGFEGWSGRVYKEYNEISIHNIDPFPIPPRWATVVSIDVGGDSPWAIGTLRTDPDNGDVFVTAEFYDKTILLRDIAAWVKNPERSRIRDWRTARFICDPENKQVIFELAAEHQIMCEAARKGPKLPGIALVAGYLHPHQGRIRRIPGQLLPDGSQGTLVVNDAPRLFVFRDCYNWRREHANWRWKRDLRTNEPLNEPEDKDDHSCFVAGTGIATPAGSRPIESLAPGDSVDTPLGPRLVVEIGSREAPTVIVHLSGGERRVLRCTPEHPLFTVYGYRRADECERIEVGHQSPDWDAEWKRQQLQLPSTSFVRPYMRVWKVEKSEPATVYNIEVAEAHCYYANGVLVSNCDYTIYGLRVHPAPIDLEQQDTELENLKLVDPASYREALYRLKGEDKKTRLVDVWGSQEAQVEDRRLPW